MPSLSHFVQLLHQDQNRKSTILQLNNVMFFYSFHVCENVRVIIRNG